MPVVCDFVVIQGDSSRRIGDTSTLWEKNFNTGGLNGKGSAFLMFMVKGLTATDSDVDVKINNMSVGKIFHSNSEDTGWYTQIINIGTGVLNDGSNELQIEAVSFPGATPGNIYDDFYIRDVICFFKQST